jgi:hypothetical protein
MQRIICGIFLCNLRNRESEKRFFRALFLFFVYKTEMTPERLHPYLFGLPWDHLNSKHHLAISGTIDPDIGAADLMHKMELIGIEPLA